MPTAIQDQFDALMRSVSSGDLDLAQTVLTNPDAVSPADQKTLAEKWGIKDRWLKWITDTATDPVVWISFLMSKYYPTGAWLKGTVPDRFVGTANEFTGVSKYTRPIEDYYRGTTVPRLVALKQFREQKVMEAAAPIFRLMERPNWKQEMPIVSMLMEGQAPPGATSELRYISQQMRGHMNEMYGFLRQAHQVTGGFEGTQVRGMTAEPLAGAKAPEFLRDYLPHIPLLGAESVFQIDGKQALASLGGGRLKGAFEAAGIGPKDVWTPQEANRLASRFSDYQMFMNRVGGQIWSSHLFPRYRQDARLSNNADLFVTDLNVLMQRYVHSVARTYAVNAPISDAERAMASIVREDGTRAIPTNEPIIVQVMNEGLRNAGAQVVERPVPGTDKIDRYVIPQSGSPIMLSALKDLTGNLLGRADEGEILWSNLFSSVGNRFKRSAGMLNPTKEQQVDFALQQFKSSQKYRTLSNGIASYFYSTTLGLNPWSAMQNLLQPALTTMPALGIGPSLRGIREFGSRVGNYSRELEAEYAALRTANVPRMASVSEAAQRAFNKAFPELGHVKIDPRLFDVDPNALGTVSGAFKTYDDFAKFMMQPFTHAEMSNQAITFYSAKHAITDALGRGEYEMPVDVAGKALSGKGLDDWINFDASNVVNSTQFRPGPGGRTIWQNGVPAFMRQFTSFPTRALSFMVNSTVRGATTRAQLDQMDLLSRGVAAVTGGRNLGTLARMVLYGRIVSEGAKDVLGVDLSGALGIMAPFQFAPEGQPFAPLPLPPAAGVAWGVVSAATNRDIKRLQPLQLPGGITVPIPRTLIPGGLELSRIGRVMTQFEPDMGGFVDEDRRLMYRGNTTDAIMAMLGVPLESNRRTRDVVERVQANRDSMRQYRRHYAAAAIQNDFKTMDSLSQQYAKEFKGMPPLSIEQKDLLRYRQNAQMTTIGRMIRGMGAQGRFLESELYQTDPELIEPRTPEMQLLNSMFSGG